MSESFDIFVSYSTDDGHLVDGLVRLLQLSGRRVFIDKNSIQPGDLWERSLRQAITGSEQVILLWCCHSSESKWVAVEIEQAVEESKPIIPLLLCGKSVPESVAKYQWIDLRYVVTHPCAHTETESIRRSPESRYIALTLPRLLGRYTPSDYLELSLGHDPTARTAIDSMTADAKIICGAVFGALELGGFHFEE